MKHWLLLALVVLTSVGSMQRASAYAAVQNKADNTEIRIVPAPGKVTIDGDLKDWDLSGAIVMFLDEASKETYHVRAAMMYDKDFVYIGGVWKDPTPLMNMTAFTGDVQNAWNADAIQVRFVSDPNIKSDASTIYGGRMPADQQKCVNHINLWYSTQDKQAGYQACYTLGYTDQVLNPAGVQGAFVKDADGKGSTFEYRVPLAVLRAPRPYQGGDQVQMQFQVHWGNELGTELKAGLTDVRNPKSNTLGYMGPDAWGLGIFMDKGNLPPPAKRVAERAEGHIPVKFTMPRDGKASISIRNAAGKTIRTGIGAVPHKAGEQVWLWDGLDDFDQPVPAGQYTAKILTHDGFGQKFVCDVGVSGTPPWQTEDDTGGWAGDFGAPSYLSIENDKVFLGVVGYFEAQKPFICTDLEGRKLYGVRNSPKGRSTTQFTDAAGNVFVSKGGQDMQVWKLAPDGTVLQKFGKPGGRPALGKFDPAGMLNPGPIAVDKNNRLWVCENDSEPKRYSVWNPDGTLYKDFYGSLPYSPAGFFDPKDPQYVYVVDVRYVVDYDKGTWRPDATILRDRQDNGVKLPGVAWSAGGVIQVVKDRKFMLINGTMSFGGATLYEEVGDAWVPRMTADWLDANNDGKVQAEEKGPAIARIATGRQIVIDGHLNLYSYVGDTWLEPTGAGKRNQPFDIVRLDFLGFGPKGELRYADKARVVAHDDEGGAFDGICADDDGSTYALLSGGLVARGERAQGTGARIAKYGTDGKELWRYANVHCGFGWTSSTYTPGFVVSAFRMSSAQHPDLLPVTGYYGQYFLIDKRDGLFVDALGQDQRSAYTMDHTMVLTENFNGNIFKHPQTGKTYFTGGDADCRIWEITGLDSIKRSEMPLTVTDAMVAQAMKNAEQDRLAALALQAKYAGGRQAAVLKRLRNAAADGKDTEWQGVAVLPIGDDQAKPAQVQIGYDDQNLYARFEVQSAVPFLNTPTDFKLLFKSGTALEVCLTPKLGERKVGPNNRHPMEVGDLRVLIARTKEGKLIATRYRPKIEAQDKTLTAFFETPAAGRETFDEIAEWNDLPMSYRAIKGGYVVEVALPWAGTAIKPAKDVKFLLDAGVVYGNEGGTRNATRALWSDKTPEVNVNNDIPTESRLHPNGWGLAAVE